MKHEEICNHEKICNLDGYCNYKTVGGTLSCCKYTPYCDHQAPRDSRNLENNTK